MTHEMLSCAEALARLQEFLDGELPTLTCDEVERHFEVCTRCWPHLRLEEHFRERVQEALGRCDVPGSLRARVVEALAREAAGSG